jgi:hypothetical protein
MSSTPMSHDIESSTKIMTSTLLNRLHYLAESDGSYYTVDGKPMYQLYLISPYIPVMGSYALYWPNFFAFITSYYFQVAKVLLMIIAICIFLFLNHTLGWVIFNCIIVTFFQLAHFLTLDKIIYFKAVTSTQVMYIFINLIIFLISRWDQNVKFEKYHG